MARDANKNQKGALKKVVIEIVVMKKADPYKALLFAVLLIVLSGLMASPTDWYLNLTPPLHATMAAWFGLMSASFGSTGLILLLRYFYLLFSDKGQGISRY